MTPMKQAIQIPEAGMKAGEAKFGLWALCHADSSSPCAIHTAQPWVKHSASPVKTLQSLDFRALFEPQQMNKMQTKLRPLELV